MSDVYMSKDGYEKLREEIARLNAEKNELAKEIGETREQGDLKENAGYIYAKEKQALVLNRIAELEAKLRKAKITDNLAVNKDEVRIGATIRVRDEGSGTEKSYTLSGTDEADPASGKISVSSPLAQGFLGSKAGDRLKIRLPSGEKEFTVLGVEYK
ncbi:MAG: transcription elongation factor GreA [Elusimicrobiales bacterium]|nr:transcription elongation factor GreA [Elusimicrobiales bacterium]